MVQPVPFRAAGRGGRVGFSGERYDTHGISEVKHGGTMRYLRSVGPGSVQLLIWFSMFYDVFELVEIYGIFGVFLCFVVELTLVNMGFIHQLTSLWGPHMFWGSLEIPWEALQTSPADFCFLSHGVGRTYAYNYSNFVHYTTIPWSLYIYIYMYHDKSRFPKIGVPPNHPFLDGIFHYKPTILGYPHGYGNPKFVVWNLNQGGSKHWRRRWKSSRVRRRMGTWRAFGKL